MYGYNIRNNDITDTGSTAPMSSRPWALGHGMTVLPVRMCTHARTNAMSNLGMAPSPIEDRTAFRAAQQRQCLVSK